MRKVWEEWCCWDADDDV